MFYESRPFDRDRLPSLSRIFVIMRRLSFLMAMSNRIAMHPQGFLAYLVSVPWSNPNYWVRRTLGREKNLHPAVGWSFCEYVSLPLVNK